MIGVSVGLFINVGNVENRDMWKQTVGRTFCATSVVDMGMNLTDAGVRLFALHAELRVIPQSTVVPTLEEKEKCATIVGKWDVMRNSAEKNQKK